MKIKKGTVVSARYDTDTREMLGNEQYIFITEIKQCPGHCLLISFQGKTETMIHTDELYVVNEEDL